MTVLARSALDPRMTSVQCDVCCPPAMATNDEAALRSSGWRTVADGADFDACPGCVRDRLWTEVPLRAQRDDSDLPEGRLPDVMVIGAAKCGTTSLHAYLDAHPDIAMAELKELRYFQDPGFEDWERWYRGQFDADAPVAGESSTMYTRSPALPGVAARMASLVPDAKLVYMVRDPVDRAVASYLEERFQLFEPRTVEEAFADLDDPFNPYLAGSRYAEQVREFRAHYPAAQLLVLPLSDLEQDPDATMARVFAFVGVDPSHRVDTGTRLNEGSAKYEYGKVGSRLRRSVAGRAVRRIPPRQREALQRAARRVLSRPMERPELSPGLRARIAEALAPDAAELRALTGLPLSDWSV